LEAEATKRKTPSWREPHDVCDWLEKHFYIEDPRDIETGVLLPPGPIRLFPHQKRILRAMVEKDEHGLFRWTTLVYSAVKKCLAPETRVLTTSLDWVPVGSLKVGDKLLGFDENPVCPAYRKGRVRGGTGRRYRVATVLDTGLAPMLARRIYLADGTVITASHDHKWLTRQKGGKGLRWRKTSGLKPGGWLSRYLPVWDMPHGYDDGYIAGCLDGEGHIRPDCREIGMGQKENELLAEFKRILVDHDIKFSEYHQETYGGDYAGHSIQKIAILGGRPWNLYMLGHFKPKRLLGKILPQLDGGIGQIWRMGDVEIVAIEETAAELVTLQTSTETYFAEGFAAHNSGKTRIAAGIVAWMAAQYGPYAECYVMANDGKQSDDRLLSAIRKTVTFNKVLNWHISKRRVSLPDGSFVEAIPVDPTGESGANPTATAWSEMWGYGLAHKERFWATMTVSPAKFGRSLRIVESYAGYSGESPTLERLYEQGVTLGKKHPDSRLSRPARLCQRASGIDLLLGYDPQDAVAGSAILRPRGPDAAAQRVPAAAQEPVGAL